MIAAYEGVMPPPQFSKPLDLWRGVSTNHVRRLIGMESKEAAVLAESVFPCRVENKNTRQINAMSSQRSRNDVQAQWLELALDPRANN